MPFILATLTLICVIWWLVRHEDDHIVMSKSEEAEGFFDDGLTYLFKDSSNNLREIRPEHIHFEVQTETKEEMESCDLRFYSVEPAPEEEDSSRRRLDQ